MLEKRKHWGFTVLVLVIKRIENVAVLEALVMYCEVGFLATRNKISYVEDSR